MRQSPLLAFNDMSLSLRLRNIVSSDGAELLG